MIKRIFIYWHTDFINSPLVVQKCLDACKYYNKNYEIIELNDNNLHEWINIDELIKNKNITITSKSDIIRLTLLKIYGGIWMDSTVLCVSSFDNWLHNYINNGFFVFSFNPVIDKRISTWFIYADKDNYIINQWYNSMIEYITNSTNIGLEYQPINTIDKWNNNKYSNHYFWIHYLFNDLYENDYIFRSEYNNCKVYLKNNPQYLQTYGLDKKIEDNFKGTFKQFAPLYKLTYRFDYSKCNNDSIYQYIINKY
jgi:hypothetical protein